MTDPIRFHETAISAVRNIWQHRTTQSLVDWHASHSSWDVNIARISSTDGSCMKVRGNEVIAVTEFEDRIFQIFLTFWTGGAQIQVNPADYCQNSKRFGQ
jgi:hypothetical protein